MKMLDDEIMSCVQCRTVADDMLRYLHPLTWISSILLRKYPGICGRYAHELPPSSGKVRPISVSDVTLVYVLLEGSYMTWPILLLAVLVPFPLWKQHPPRELAPRKQQALTSDDLG